MSEKLQVPTAKQLEALAALQKIQLAKVMFYFLLSAFAVVLIAALVAIFAGKNWAAIVGLITNDGLLGLCFYRMVKFLYPTQEPDKPIKTEAIPNEQKQLDE